MVKEEIKKGDNSIKKEKVKKEKTEKCKIKLRRFTYAKNVNQYIKTGYGNALETILEDPILSGFREKQFLNHRLSSVENSKSQKQYTSSGLNRKSNFVGAKEKYDTLNDLYEKSKLKNETKCRKLKNIYINALESLMSKKGSNETTENVDMRRFSTCSNPESETGIIYTPSDVNVEIDQNLFKARRDVINLIEGDPNRWSTDRFGSINSSLSSLSSGNSIISEAMDKYQSKDDCSTSMCSVASSNYKKGNFATFDVDVNIKKIKNRNSAQINNLPNKQAIIHQKFRQRSNSFSYKNKQINILLDSSSTIEKNHSSSDYFKTLFDNQILEKCILTRTCKSNEAVINFIRKRFHLNLVYTWLDDSMNTLLFINPYCWLPHYNPVFCRKYDSTSQINNNDFIFHGAKSKDYYNFGNTHFKKKFHLLPHIFAVAQKTYNNLVRTGNSQLIIVTGEAASGKSFTIQLLLAQFRTIGQYKARNTSNIIQKSIMSQKNFNSEKMCQDFNSKLLGFIRILEEIETVPTNYSKNSTRSFHSIKLQYDKSANIAGAKICNYFLNHTNLFPNLKQRNFNIFYAIFHGLPENLCKEFHISENHNFKILNIISSDDDEEFIDKYHNMVKSIKMAGISIYLRNKIFKTLVTIMHIGNVDYVKTSMDGDVTITNKDIIPIIAELLEIEEIVISSMLLVQEKRISEETIIIPYTLDECKRFQQSICKSIYLYLFKWIISIMNRQLNVSDEKLMLGNINIVDMYRFENLVENNFEQFIGNYITEKIDNVLLSSIFRYRKMLYMSEGQEYLENNISYMNESLYSDKNCGLFILINEECRYRVGNAERLSQNIHSQNPSTSTHIKMKMLICHYKDTAKYDISTFREKNMDIASDIIMQIGIHTKSLFLNDIIHFELSLHETLAKLRLFIKFIINLKCAVTLKQCNKLQIKGMKSRYLLKNRHQYSNFAVFATLKSNIDMLKRVSEKSKADTVISKVEIAVQELIEEIEKSEPHIIRCINPNKLKEKRLFDESFVYQQLRHSTIFNQFNLLLKEYDNIMTKNEFQYQYDLILVHYETIENLLVCVGSSDHYKIGLGKIFLNNTILIKLDKIQNMCYKYITKNIFKVYSQIQKKESEKYRNERKFSLLDSTDNYLSSYMDNLEDLYKSSLNKPAISVRGISNWRSSISSNMKCNLTNINFQSSRRNEKKDNIIPTFPNIPNLIESRKGIIRFCKVLIIKVDSNVTKSVMKMWDAEAFKEILKKMLINRLKTELFKITEVVSVNHKMSSDDILHIVKRILPQELKDFVETYPSVEFELNSLETASQLLFYEKCQKFKRKSSNLTGFVDKFSKAEETIRMNCGHRMVIEHSIIPHYCEYCNKLIDIYDKIYRCLTCEYVIHRKCLTKNKRICIGAKTLIRNLINTPIHQLIENDKIPPAIEKLLNYIETKKPYTERIYRLSGAKNKLDHFINILNHCVDDERVTQLNPDEYDISILCSSVKYFLNQLPEPLINKEFLPLLIEAAEMEDLFDRYEIISNIICRMPKHNVILFDRIINHLAIIARESNINKMDAHNLAIIFAPNVIQPNYDEKSMKNNLIDAYIKIIETMITTTIYIIDGMSEN